MLAWDRRGTLRPLALQSVEGRRLLPGLSEEERMSSWHLIAPDGARWSAGAAGAPLLKSLPGGRVPARILELSPGLAERAYSLVARNRGRLGRLIPRRALERAEARISRRER
jgi:predicted DCC family thiol-disulfide oxidoreductase YuxK